jgi:hypothetical protein
VQRSLNNFYYPEYATRAEALVDEELTAITPLLKRLDQMKHFVQIKPLLMLHANLYMNAKVYTEQAIYELLPLITKSLALLTELHTITTNYSLLITTKTVLKKRVYFVCALMVFARKHLVGFFQLMPLLAEV